MNDALQRRALALGAKLELNGQTFNAARSQGKPVPRVVTPKVEPPAEPKAEAKAEPSQAQSIQAMEAFAGASYLIADSNAELLKTMQQQLSQPSKAKRWTFTIHRDDRGNMTSIDALSKD